MKSPRSSTTVITRKPLKQTAPKAVLLSVKPVYAELLTIGAKRYELRRRFPMNLEKGTRVFIYASSPTKGVIGECVIEDVLHLSIAELWGTAGKQAMIAWQDFKQYYQGVDYGYAIKMGSAKRYSSLIPLDALKSKVGYRSPKMAPQSYCYVNC